VQSRRFAQSAVRCLSKLLVTLQEKQEDVAVEMLSVSNGRIHYDQFLR
jgi:hypothetical protein